MTDTSHMHDRLQVAAESVPTNEKEVHRVTLWGLLVNLVLSGIKFLFGVLGGSQALVADAVHSLSDSVTDVVVLVGVRFWSAPPDESHPHGHGRIETLITFFIGIALASVGIGLAYRAIATLHDHQTASPGWVAFLAACAPVVKLHEIGQSCYLVEIFRVEPFVRLVKVDALQPQRLFRQFFCGRNSQVCPSVHSRHPPADSLNPARRVRFRLHTSSHVGVRACSGWRRLDRFSCSLLRQN